MECTVTSTGFTCALDETTAQLRFTTRSEAEEELRSIARRHGFELKVRSSRSAAAYLCCLSGSGAGCGFQAKLSNTSREVTDAWCITITKPTHNHPLQPQPTPTPTDPSATWTAVRRTRREIELAEQSELSDAQRWRLQPTEAEEQQQKEDESESEAEVKAEAEAQRAAEHESLIDAFSATSCELNPLERLLTIPLPDALAALDRLREHNHVEAELVHHRIQELRAIIRDMRNTSTQSHKSLCFSSIETARKREKGKNVCV